MEKALNIDQMEDVIRQSQMQILGKEVTIGSVDRELRLLWEQDRRAPMPR